MGAARGARGRGRPAAGSAVAHPRAPGQPGAGERPVAPPRRCHSCARELSGPTDVGWECDCGVVVCSESACFEEYFKFVADGEATRCLSCGLVM